MNMKLLFKIVMTALFLMSALVYIAYLLIDNYEKATFFMLQSLFIWVIGLDTRVR